MPIIRKKLAPADVYPEDIRYDMATDKVQRKVGDDWMDSPESDPRNQTIYPPRITSNTKCDAAESVKDALQNQIDQILTAIENTATVFSIAGLVLGLFSFGVFEIFIGLALAVANAMIDAGAGAIGDALTETIWHKFTCILYCHMTSQGRVKDGHFTIILTDIDTKIGGLAGLILNSFLQIAGEGGINNLASLGESTGSCTDCDCDCPPRTGLTPISGRGIVTYLGDNEYHIQSQLYYNPDAGVSLQGASLVGDENTECFVVKNYTTTSPDGVRTFFFLCDGTYVGYTNPIGVCISAIDFAAPLTDLTSPYTVTVQVCGCTDG